MNRRVFLGALPMAGFAQQKIVGGPYALHTTSRGGNVCWVVEQDGPGGLKYKSVSMKKSARRPGETIVYKAYDGGEGWFRSAPEGPSTYSAVIFGDTRSRHDMHKRVIDAIVRSESPDFVIHTGDLVADDNNLEQWPRFFEIERELLRKTTYFAALGNHERNNAHFYEFFQIGKPYYSFDWGAAHFSVINSDLGNAAKTQADRDSFWAEQTRWLEQDLAAHQKAELRFAISHHPQFTAVKKRQDEKHPAKALTSLFTKHKVHAVFNGHDHNYQHHVHEGVHYVVTGGGGAPLYATDGPIPGITQKVESIENYVRLMVEPGQARVEARALDGRVIDAFTMTK